jgi:hypothetical protein
MSITNPYSFGAERSSSSSLFSALFSDLRSPTTYRHSDPPRLDSHDEFWRVEDAMTKILGLKPKYFRPPFGKYNDQVLQVAAQRGYTKMILWSDDTQDASGECDFGCKVLGLGLGIWLIGIVFWGDGCRCSGLAVEADLRQHYRSEREDRPEP